MKGRLGGWRVYERRNGRFGRWQVTVKGGLVRRKSLSKGVYKEREGGCGEGQWVVIEEGG